MEEHEELADDLDAEVEDLQAHADELKEEIDETRQDWESKQQSADVPGAEPPDESDA
jgi:peptidoglycan hydrolase CwlO-like protein